MECCYAKQNYGKYEYYNDGKKRILKWWDVLNIRMMGRFEY